MTRPHIDHSFLSPNGRMSARARQRELDRVFGGENLITTADLHRERLAAIQPTEIERMTREAAQCRDLAARGFKVRSMTRMAEALEASIRASGAAREES